MLKDRALLIYYSASQPKQQAVDKEASRKTCDDHGAKQGAAKVIKQLHDETMYAPIRLLYNRVRAWVYSTTLPWLDNGLRIRPTRNYIEWAAQFRAYKDELDRLADAYCADMAAKLKPKNGASPGCSSSDYPDVRAMRDQFQMSIAIYPVPSSDDFRLENLGDAAEQAIIRAEAETRALQALQASTEACYQRLHKVVAHLAGELSRADKVKYHDSLVDNIRELVAILPELNISDDSTLASFIDEVDRKLAGVAVDDLKHDEALRKSVSADAAAIAARLSTFM